MKDRCLIQINLNLTKEKNKIINKFLKNIPYGKKADIIYDALAFYVMNADIEEDDYYACFDILKAYIKGTGNKTRALKDISENENITTAPPKNTKTEKKSNEDKKSDAPSEETAKEESSKRTPYIIAKEDNPQTEEQKVDEETEKEMLAMLNDLDGFK